MLLMVMMITKTMMIEIIITIAVIISSVSQRWWLYDPHRKRSKMQANEMCLYYGRFIAMRQWERGRMITCCCGRNHKRLTCQWSNQRDCQNLLSKGYHIEYNKQTMPCKRDWTIKGLDGTRRQAQVEKKRHYVRAGTDNNFVRFEGQRLWPSLRTGSRDMLKETAM